jgi:biopolymer transport protein ExbD
MAFKFKRNLQSKVTVDMVPMIDIIFQLVIFFMVATTFKVTTGIELDLPKAESVNTVQTSVLKISVIDKENIYVDNYKTDIDNFNIVLKNFVLKDKAIKQTALVNGDKAMEYQLLIDVMDALRINGFKNIDLSLKKKE